MIQVKARYINKKYEKVITQWSGLNQNDLIADNELSGMSNCSTKNFPLLSPRAPRTALTTLTGVGWALFAAPTVSCWVDGTSFKYNGTTKGTVTASSKSMVDFNSRIGIFPDAKKYDYISDTFSNMLGKLNLLKYGFDDNGDVDYTTGSTKMRNKILIGVTPSTSYTLVNDKEYAGASAYYYDVNGVFISNATVNFSSFTTPATAYYMNIDITGTDLTCAVSITGAVYPTKTAIPSIDYACTCNNRVWGVKGDNVYASRLGNIDDWTTMNADPLVTDAWTVDTGSPGDFTGIVTYKNSVYAFKKDAMYKQFGFKPIEFELVKINAIGCISPKSIVEVNEVLYWLAKDGIYRFTGGNPELISYPLNETYVSGVAGRDNKRYYISLYNGTTYKLYTYDTEFGVWETEDQSNIKEFIYQYTSAAPQGYLAVLRSDNKIYRYNYGTEAITMMVATKVFTEDTTRKKGYSNVCFRVDLESGTTLGIYVKSDNLTEVLERTYTADDFRSFVVPIPVRRCDHMQILFALTGEGKIYAMEREMYIGSKVGETFDNPES